MFAFFILAVLLQFGARLFTAASALPGDCGELLGQVLCMYGTQHRLHVAVRKQNTAARPVRPLQKLQRPVPDHQSVCVCNKHPESSTFVPEDTHQAEQRPIVHTPNSTGAPTPDQVSDTQTYQQQQEQEEQEQEEQLHRRERRFCCTSRTCTSACTRPRPQCAPGHRTWMPLLRCCCRASALTPSSPPV